MSPVAHLSRSVSLSLFLFLSAHTLSLSLSPLLLDLCPCSWSHDQWHPACSLARTKENGSDRDPLHPDHLGKRPCTLSPAQRYSPSNGLPHPTPPPHYRLEDMAMAHHFRDSYRHPDPRELRERHRQLGEQCAGGREVGACVPVSWSTRVPACVCREHPRAAMCMCLSRRDTEEMGVANGFERGASPGPRGDPLWLAA